MKYTELYTASDNKSYFKEITTAVESLQPLGRYSKNYPVASMQFRDFDAGNVYDWHNAPQAQYIVFLEGDVEVETSSGEKRVFKSGDIMLANDLVGEGHITRTLTAGRSLIIKIEPPR